MPDSAAGSDTRDRADRLISAVQDLSLARDLPAVMEIVRHAARDLTGADGASFVLRDGDMCFYAEEDAISPLWKGCRFPMSSCISGWAMLNREPAVIEDIYSDARVPVEAYRPTFVKSLVMVPIRTRAPVGAIGNYWAARHRATAEQLRLLQALADSTSIAIENVQLFAEMEQRIRARTAELEAANQELEAFSYSVSHDLRAPLRAIDGFSSALQEQAGGLDAAGRKHLERIRAATARMGQLIEDLLGLSRVVRADMAREAVDLSVIAREVMDELRRSAPERGLQLVIADGLRAEGDPRLLRILLENLLHNAWKYSSRALQARITFGSEIAADGGRVFIISDNGAGFDMRYADKLFGAFQRLHSDQEFPGTGVGLATARRIVHRHGGRIWADSAPGQGATFRFTLKAANDRIE